MNINPKNRAKAYETVSSPYVRTSRIEMCGVGSCMLAGDIYLVFFLCGVQFLWREIK